MSGEPVRRPPPPDWNRTLADLMAEMKRGERDGITGEEADWARAFEASLLPPGTVFPAGGEVWEAIGDAEVLVMQHYAAPFTLTNEAILPLGERVRVIGSHLPRPTVIAAVPLRCDALLETLVPADVRAEPRFDSYSLSIPTAYFSQHFWRVDA